MTDSAQRPSTLPSKQTGNDHMKIALRRFLELRTDAPGFVKDFTIAVLQAEHVLDAESPTSAPATRATPTNALIRPYHDNAMWRDMKLNDPESFADAVAVDTAIRNGVLDRKNGGALSKARWFLHRSCQPLETVDFRNAEDAGQERLFDEKGFAVECEGMCGV